MVQIKKPIFRSRVSQRHIALIGFGCITLGIVLAIGLLVHLAGYSFVTIDKPNTLYSGVTTRMITQNSGTQPPFVAKYPVTGNNMVDASIRTQINNIVRPYLIARRGLGDKVKYEQLRVDYSIMFYNRKTLTVGLFQQKTRPEGISGQNVETLVYDMDSSKRISTNDIVKNMPALLDILYDYLRQHYSDKLTQADLVRVLDLQPSDFKEIIPYENIIGLTFDPRVTKKPGDEITLGINKSLLKGIIADRYTETSQDLANKQPSMRDIISTMPSRDEPVNPAGKMLALTFDDGPGVDTPRLLDALKKYRAHATFFVLGSLVDKYSPTIKREVAEGNEIGNHSWNHADLTRLSGPNIDSQVQETQAAVQHTTGGFTPRLLRPPYGAINAAVVAHSGGLTPTLWTVDTVDWRDRNTDVIFDRILAGAQNRAVILLHDIHPRSVDAAILAIQRLRSEGWQLVTVSQLN